MVKLLSPKVFRGRSVRTAGWIVVLAALCCAPRAGWARSASLVMSDVCDDPAGVFDHQWATIRADAADLYFMAADGIVSRVSEGGGNFNNYEDLYVFAHGGGGTIGGMGYAAFVAGLENAHPAVPNSVFFGVCYSADGPESLLKRVNDEYGGSVNRLAGGVVACALTGNGSRDLATAEYRIRVQHSHDALYDQIVDNIHAKWSQNYPGTAMSYADYCRSALSPFNAARLRAFMTTVVAEFSLPSLDPADSTNYLDLVALNINGDPLTVCGQDPQGTGRVACP